MDARHAAPRLLLALLAALTAGAVLAAAAAPAPTQHASTRRSLIVGGVTARANRFPYVVSIRRNARGEAHFCGGTLITPTVVLTAAHCFHSKSGALLDSTWTRPKLRIGAYDTAGGRYEARDAVALLVPDVFNWRTNNFDVALLLLKEPSAQPTVRLARGKRKMDRQRAGAPLYAVGWGKLAYNGALPKRLQEVALDYISLKQCAKFAPKFDWATNSMICAGSPVYRRNSCSGDSGGPLLQKGRASSRDVQVGIVSWGWSCGNRKPGVYSDVASVRGFIDYGIRKLIKPATPVKKPLAQPGRRPVPQRGLKAVEQWAGAAAEAAAAEAAGGRPELESFWRRVP